MSATLTFNLNYQRKITYIHHGDNVPDLVAYAGELLPYTRAGITRATITLNAPLQLTEKVGEYATVEQVAKLYMRDNLNDTKYFLILPAPVSHMFDAVSGQGFRVKEAVGQQLTAFYSAYSGLTLEFIDGWLCGPNT